MMNIWLKPNVLAIWVNTIVILQLYFRNRWTDSFIVNDPVALKAVPAREINISCRTCFINRCKINWVKYSFCVLIKVCLWIRCCEFLEIRKIDSWTWENTKIKWQFMFYWKKTMDNTTQSLRRVWWPWPFLEFSGLLYLEELYVKLKENTNI